MEDSEAVGEEFELKEILGRGAFSVVYRAIRKTDGEEVAIKRIQKISIDRKSQKRLTTEVEILKRVNHTNIIPLKQIVETRDKLFLVMELVDGGELFDKIIEKHFYSERDASIIVNQIVGAIDYLHKNNIAHRDLKPENLLLRKNDDTQVMISDFGLSRILGDDSMMSTACGTPYYVAPEVVKAISYGKEVDMWSIGVITYFLLAGFPPFMGKTLTEIVELIIHANYSFPSPYWDNISKEAMSFVSSLLVLDPSKRLKAEEALKHPWLQGCVSDKRLNNSSSLRKHYNQGRKQHSF